MQIREPVVAESLGDKTKGRLRVIVVDIVHFAERRYAHTDAIRSPDRCQSLGDFEQQSRSVRHRATVGVCAPVGAGLNELIEQIAVGGMYLDAAEIGGLCVFAAALIWPHQGGNL